MKNNNHRQRIKWYKRKYLIDLPVQLRVIFRLAVVTLVFDIVICFISYKWVINLTPLFDQAQFGPMKPIEAYQIVADSLLYRLIVVMIVLFLSFIVAGIYATLRFAGPIWKLQRDLKSFFNGEDIGAIQFRRRDDYQELPDLVNRLIDGYKGDRD